MSQKFLQPAAAGKEGYENVENGLKHQLKQQGGSPFRVFEKVFHANAPVRTVSPLLARLLPEFNSKLWTRPLQSHAKFVMAVTLNLQLLLTQTHRLDNIPADKEEKEIG
jgi:hypothetical protein